MVEKGIREGICHAIHRYAKDNNKYMFKSFYKFSMRKNNNNFRLIQVFIKIC